MLPKKIEDILNRQLEREGYSSNLYLAMASWAENNGFSGVADWLYAQAEEEWTHMIKFVKYINDRGGRAIIPALQEPIANQTNVLDLFGAVMKHEEFVSGSINEIVAACIDEKDYTTHSWIQWFVTEQIEEEASVRAILDKLKLVGESNMYIFDRDIMGMRGAGSSAQA